MTDPVVSDVFISSNNEYDSTLAMIGDTVFIEFISSEIAQVHDVLIGSRSAMVSGDGNNWLAVLEMDGTDIEGDIAFTIDYLDLAGNQGGQRLNTDDDSAVLFDRTNPEMIDVSIESNNIYDNSLAMIGDSVMISLVSSENVQEPSVMIAGLFANVTGDGTYWNAAAEMIEENIEGVIEIEIDYMDLAGNISRTLSVTDTSSVRFDKTLPAMTSVTVGSNNIYDPLLATVENTIMITFTLMKQYRFQVYSLLEIRLM